MAEFSREFKVLKETALFLAKLFVVSLWFGLLVAGSLLFFGNIGKDTAKAGWGFLLLAVAVVSFVIWALNRFVGRKIEVEIEEAKKEGTYGTYYDEPDEPPPLFEFLKKRIAGQNEALVEIHNTIAKKSPIKRSSLSSLWDLPV